MPTLQFRCICTCWAIITLIFALTGDVRLFAQERGGGQGRGVQEQQERQEDEETSLDSLIIEIIPDSLLEGVKIYRYQPNFGAAKLYAPKVGSLTSSTTKRSLSITRSSNGRKSCLGTSLLDDLIRSPSIEYNVKSTP